MLQVLLGKDPILFKLGGDFLQFCTTKQAFIRISDVPDDLPKQLAAALQALEGVEKGDLMVTDHRAQANLPPATFFWKTNWHAQICHMALRSSDFLVTVRAVYDAWPCLVDVCL